MAIPLTRRGFLGTAGAAASLSAIQFAAGAGTEWGHLSGRFVYDGDPPVRKPIKITVDPEFCGKCGLLEENLVVDPKTKGVAHVAVWMILRRGGPAPLIHESYAEAEKAEINLDSTCCRIDPHVCLLRTTQSLLLRNTDPIGDGIKIDSFRNLPLNVMLPVDGQIHHSMPQSETRPVHVGCPVHPWESGWLVVLDHPYMAVSGQDGRFTIKNLPVGKWTFQFWHEKTRYVSEVKVAGKPVTWPRGRLDMEIKPGKNDLGDITLAPTLFKK